MRMNNDPILYAEDEEDDAFFLKRAFDLAGITNPLVVVNDGQDAVDYCTGVGRYSDRGQYPLPCLLLLDLNLPRKSGLEVLKRIRSDPPISVLPIIVLSSSLQDADVHRAYVQGANAYLVKPSNPDDLVAIAKTIKDFWLTQNRAATDLWKMLGTDNIQQ